MQRHCREGGQGLGGEIWDGKVEQIMLLNPNYLLGAFNKLNSIRMMTNKM